MGLVWGFWGEKDGGPREVKEPLGARRWGET